ncbi:MAG: DNA-binding transcriptional regulator OxyR [SAR324 cluster bacterium]|jgi:LysR family hydrogen peroxide-inducible transcriptional activator|nr:DNA-binding transcriptional regulator OxyR [Deltaproteobacteria bacterium]MDP6091819.1 DNA-binding transcriptional regulator OxyR [SAR324 cluster bacterium]MDP6246449.1 DNA-binding transcriptional regulator OxyR [SAR324 cluster bacterium]MDP6463593.1 DNA-binding transcriptional regulator OxyR [SAR324 cluster bacterium]MDP7139899.1 DNA-binding transcriptional regulator OxyR [SAR324 cluster bacterium]|tara:strand:- start:6409 stop:7311 length:903 start_codon:yes stop_codon:yes gene_type:complete
MNIRDFEYLVALDELRSFRKASERCHVTQPTLSGQLRKLEDYLGVLLVERTKRKVMLTPVGKEVVRRARLILQEVEQIEEISVSFKDPMQGKLRMGLIPTLGPYLLPFMIPAMVQEYPRLQLFLYEEQTHILLKKLSDAELDVIILALPVSSSGLSEIELFDEPFLLALPRGHELSIQDSVSLSDLSEERILLLEDGHCLRDQALEVCMMAGATENPEFQGTSLETLRHMVSAGMGVTLMPYYSVFPNSGSNPPMTYLQFDAPVPSRKIGLLFRESSQRREGFLSIANTIRSSLPDFTSI